MVRFSGPVVGGEETKHTFAVCNGRSIYDCIPANLAKLENTCAAEARRGKIGQSAVVSELPSKLVFSPKAAVLTREQALERIGEDIFRALFCH